MVMRKIVSFDRLIEELKLFGRFSENAPCCVASIEAKEVLDYLYDELVNMESHDQFSHTGRLIEVTFQSNRIVIRSMHKVSKRIKSFATSQNLRNELIYLLFALTSTYHSLRFVTDANFIHDPNCEVSYFLEYNNS